MAKKVKKDHETLGWLMAKGRTGAPRIETLSWNRLARIYRRAEPGSAIRKAIEKEARACGYTPSTIIALHGYLHEKVHGSESSQKRCSNKDL